jgi:aspartate beta-hydroxylase
VWVPAARSEAFEYGPNWRTLVLQDRGEWDPANVRLFPRTHRLFADLGAPTLEVFFARQEGNTGIKSHTDGANFIQTSHLGLDVPEGECWIKAGEHTREWRNGRALVCDTSFMHETHNASDRDRLVLIMRHWHPEMAPLERTAAAFLFRALDDPTPASVKAAQRAADKALRGEVAAGGKRKGKGKAGGAKGGGGGFGRS